jgi:hypothetical protein
MSIVIGAVVRRLTSVALVALGMLALVAAPAGAVPTRERSFELRPAAGFGKPTGIAVDQETGNVYVADSDANVVDVFGAKGGKPVGGVPAQIAGFSFGEQSVGVAFDNACYYQRLEGAACKAFDSSNGDVYVANHGASVVDKLTLNASHEYEIVHEFPFAGVTGVAVDPRGNVYVVGPGEESITVFNSLGVEVGRIAQHAVEGPTYIAVDALGDVYVGNGREEVAKIVVNAKDEVQSGSLLTEGATAVAVDSQADAFVDEDQVIVEYASSGSLLGQFRAGLNSGSHGIAVNDKTGDVYAANEEGPMSVVVFAFPPTPPVLFTGAASHLGLTSATVAGTVNPEGSPVTACEVEYGVATSYGSSMPCASLPAGSGTSPVPVTAGLTGLQPDTFYHYRLAATSIEGTGYGRDETLVTAPSIAGTTSAAGTTSFAATLIGAIVAGEITPTYHFVYVDEAGYRPGCADCEDEPADAYALGASVPEPDSNAGANALDTVNQTVSGLQPDTTYHFALVVTNFGGSVTVGPDATFTTRPVVPPTGSTGGTQGVTQTTAVLTGTLDPEGLATSYRFEYGTSAGYGSSWPSITIPAGDGSAGQGVAIEVPGLEPATTYHYRLVATNEDGTMYGSDRSFTTPGYPSSVIQEAPVLSVRLGINPEPTSSSSTKSSGKDKAKKRKQGKSKKKGKQRKKK